MTLRNLSVLLDPDLAASNGTANAYLPASGSSDTKLVIYRSADTSLINRRTIEFSVKPPKVSAGAPNGYTQARNVIFLRFPVTLENGETTVDTLKIELARDVETSNADVTSYLKTGAQMFFDSDATEFFHNQSLN